MLFSIIMPAYNAAKHLAGAVETLFAQSLNPEQYEILIVDDGSTDGTWPLMNQLAKRFTNLRLFKNPGNLGQGAARNLALSEARGEYISFLDADDLLRSDALEMYAREIREEKSEIIFSNILKINHYGDILPLTAGRKRHNLDNFKSLTIQGQHTFCAFGAIYRRDFLALNRIRFSEGIFFEDIEFVCRAVLAAATVRGLEADLYYWRATADSSTSSISLRKINDAFTALEKMPGLLEEYGVLGKYLDDWRCFGQKFLELTEQRILQARPVENNLLTHLKKQAAESEIFAKYGLTIFFNKETSPDEPETNPDLQEAASGAVVMVANVDYQVRHFVAVARQLNLLGVKSVIFDISRSKSFSVIRAISAEETAMYADVCLYSFDFARIDPLFLNARAYLVAADWGYFRNLVFTLRRRNIPVIGFYEGINDDDLLAPPAPPTKKFLPYRHTEYLLLPGQYYKKIYPRQKTTVVGLPSLRALIKEAVCFPEKPRVVINVNFSYGVLEEARKTYLDSAAEACRRLNLDFVISQHPADTGNLSSWPVSDKSVYEEIRNGSILISRFSTCVMEALALGKPVIYHNPHGEKFPKFLDDPLEAYQVSHSTDGLIAALEKALSDISRQVDIRARAKDFLQFHANIYSKQPPEYYAAAAIKEIVNQDKDDFQKRLLHFAVGGSAEHCSLPEPVNDNLRLIWNYKNSSWSKKSRVLLLLDRPRLRAHLLKNRRKKLIRWLIKFII